MKRLKTVIFVVIILILVPICSFANTLTLNIKVDKEEIEIGDEIKVTVLWNKEMQAADFYLNYNCEKLEYITCNIDEVFVNNKAEEGKIKTSWISLDDSNRTEIEYTFRVLKGGKAKFTTTIDGGFATGNLEIPSEYNEAELTVRLSQNNIVIYIAIIVIIFIITLMLKNKKNKERG